MACFLLPSKNIFNHFFSQHFQSSKHSTVIKRKNRLIPCEKIQVQNVCCCQFWKERILLKSDSLSYRLSVSVPDMSNSIETAFAIAIFGTIAIGIAIANAIFQLLLLLLILLRRSRNYCYWYC